MTAFHPLAKPAALFLVLVSMTCVSGSAQAGTGWLWLDSVFATPAAPPQPSRLPWAKRARPVHSVVVAPAPRPIQVSAVAPASSADCFWCNRPVYVSGLSF